MTSRDFCYFLQGFFELRGDAAPITLEQATCIQRHLALVFVHEIDPSAGSPEHQAKLDAVHEGVTRPEVETAIKDALSKLPRPEPPGGYTARC